MKKRFSENRSSEFWKKLRPKETPGPLSEKNNIFEQTFYRWRKKYGGMEVSETRRLRSVEKENSEHKKLVAELTLDKRMLQDILSKKL